MFDRVDIRDVSTVSCEFRARSCSRARTISDARRSSGMFAAASRPPSAFHSFTTSSTSRCVSAVGAVPSSARCWSVISSHCSSVSSGSWVIARITFDRSRHRSDRLRLPDATAAPMPAPIAAPCRNACTSSRIVGTSPTLAASSPACTNSSPPSPKAFTAIVAIGFRPAVRLSMCRAVSRARFSGVMASPLRRRERRASIRALSPVAASDGIAAENPMPWVILCPAASVVILNPPCTSAIEPVRPKLDARLISVAPAAVCNQSSPAETPRSAIPPAPRSSYCPEYGLNPTFPSATPAATAAVLPDAVAPMNEVNTRRAAADPNEPIPSTSNAAVSIASNQSGASSLLYLDRWSPAPPPSSSRASHAPRSRFRDGLSTPIATPPQPDNASAYPTIVDPCSLARANCSCACATRVNCSSRFSHAPSPPDSAPSPAPSAVPIPGATSEPSDAPTSAPPPTPVPTFATCAGADSSSPRARPCTPSSNARALRPFA